MRMGRILFSAVFALSIRALSSADVCMEQLPPIMPIGPRYPAIAYDTLRERLMVFAQARDGDGAPNEGLWALVGGEWQCLDCPAASIPRFTTQAQAVYDEARDRFMLMRTPTAAYEYDGESWALRNFAGVTFSLPIVWWSVAYDSDAGRTIIASAGPGEIIRLFSYDGVQGVQLPDPPTPPGEASIAYDSVRHVLVMVFRSVSHFETWEFNGSNWTLRAAGEPMILGPESMAFDEARGRTVAVVGQGTVEWDGTAWTTTPVAPVRGWSGRAVFDAAQQRVVAWTWDPAGSTPLPTWRMSEWTGTAWQFQTGLELSARASAYARVARTDRGYLFGGNLAIDPTLFWEFDGLGLRPIADAGPSARVSASLAWDSVRERLVLFGGVSPNGAVQYRDTWEWAPESGWILRATSGPVANAEASMTFDEARGVVVKVGGVNTSNGQYVDETWEWDGAVWTNRNVTGPGRRAFATFVYCADLRSCLLTHGARFPANSNASSEVWQWNGQQWTSYPGSVYISGEGYPAIRSAYYDTARRRLVSPDPSTPMDLTVFWDILERRWDYAIGTETEASFPWSCRMPYLPGLDAFAVVGGTYQGPGSPGQPINLYAIRSAYFESDPQSARYIEGESFSISASLSDTIPSDVYRWYRGHTALSDDSRYAGTDSYTLTISDAHLEDAGEYRLRAVTSCGVVISAAATIDVFPPCDGDASGDRVVDLLDLATLLTHIGAPNGATRSDGDFDQDGDVDLVDLATLLSNFGALCD